MKKNKNWLFCGLVLFCLLIVSFLMEFFGFQIRLLTLDDNEKGIVEINDYSEVIEEKKKIIEINLDECYINKFSIAYHTDIDVSYSIYYVGDDYYDAETEIEIKDTFDNEVNKTVVNLRNDISRIRIVYDEDSDIQIDKIVIDNEVHINYFRLLFIYSIFVLIFLLVQFYKKGFNTSKLHCYFIVIGLVIGSILILLQPSATYYSWDDQIHFVNVNELFGGEFVWNIGEFSMIDATPVGRDSINSIEEQIDQANYLNQNSQGNYFSNAGRFIAYNKVAYIPSAIGYHFCKLLKLPFIVCFKVGKFMNLLAYLLIMGYAIKISKIGKRLLTVIGLIPTSLFLACQYAYDPGVTSGVTLGMVILINWFVDKNCKVDFKTILLFLCSMLYGCLPKAVYIPLILLFLFIPKDRFKDKKQCMMVKLGILLICLAVMATFVLPTVSTDSVAGDARGGATSVTEQLKLMVQYPVGYLQILQDTMGVRFLHNFLSNDVLLNYSYMKSTSKVELNNFYYLFLGLLIFVAFTDTNKFELKRYQRLLGILLNLGVMLLIWTALYLSFTPVGLNTINGVQARYFIPLMFLMIVCLQSNKLKNNFSDKFYNLLILAIPVMVLMVSIYYSILLPYCF